MTDWMNEEYGVPHKNGMVRFYLIGIDEDVYGYLGWHDMTDWDKGWEKVWAAAEARKGEVEGEFKVLRHDQVIDLNNNLRWALEEALEDKDETTFLWWYKKDKSKENT